MSTIVHRNNQKWLQIDASLFWEQMEEFSRKANSAVKLFRINRSLTRLIDYNKDIVASKQNIEQIEDMLISIDNVVDEVEDIKQEANIIQRVLLDRILSKLLTIQFTLNNKVADYIGENYQNRPRRSGYLSHPGCSNRRVPAAVRGTK